MSEDKAMDSNFYYSLLQKPEYQQAIQKLMQVHPAIKAAVNLQPADEAFMTNALLKQNELNKLSLASRKAEGEYNLQAGLGLTNLRTRINTATQAAEDKLKLEQQQMGWSNALGMANVGVGLYGMSKKAKLKEKITDYYLANL